MADYTLRIHQLSGALLGEVTLPGTALARDILTAFAQEPQRLLVKRKLMYQGKILAETDVLHTLFSKGEVGEVIDLHLLQQSLQVQILRDEGSETSRDSMRLNVALCGPPQSGKSSIVTRLVSDTFLDRDFIAAIGVDFKRIHVLVDDVPYLIVLWDEPTGKERFRTIRQAFFKGRMPFCWWLISQVLSPFGELTRCANRLRMRPSLPRWWLATSWIWRVRGRFPMKMLKVSPRSVVSITWRPLQKMGGTFKMLWDLPWWTSERTERRGTNHLQSMSCESKREADAQCSDFGERVWDPNQKWLHGVQNEREMLKDASGFFSQL